MTIYSIKTVTDGRPGDPDHPLMVHVTLAGKTIHTKKIEDWSTKDWEQEAHDIAAYEVGLILADMIKAHFR